MKGRVEVMKFTARINQYSYGQAIGILQFGDCRRAFIPGSVGNATTYRYPVLFKEVPGLSFQSLLSRDRKMWEPILEAALWLQRSGVRAITSNCGFFALWQKELSEALQVPCFLSSLLQVPMLSRSINKNEKVGILTADSRGIDEGLLQAAGIGPDMPIAIQGMQDYENFRKNYIDRQPELDSDAAGDDIVAAAKKLVSEYTEVKILLMECSEMPPQALRVQEATGLPVYDFITMIDFVFSGLIRKPFEGFM